MGIVEDIQQAEADLASMQTRMDSYLRAFLRDGNISDPEQEMLDRVTANINRVAQRLEELQAQYAIVGVDEDGTIHAREISISPRTDEDIQSDEAVLQTLIGKSSYKGDFNRMLGIWCNACNQKITQCSVEAIADSLEENVSADDLIAIVGVIVPGANLITSVLSIHGSLERAMSASSSGATLADISHRWTESFAGIVNNHQEIFEKFAEDWMSEYYHESLNSAQLDNAFQGAIDEYSSTYLADPDDVGRAYIACLMRNVSDPILDGDDDAGDAEITMTYIGDRAPNANVAFTFRHGQLDDISETFKTTIDRVYGRSTRVMDMPIKITISIVSYDEDELAVVQRTDMAEGSDSFNRVSGSREIIELFMAEQAYRLPLLGNLRFDI